MDTAAYLQERWFNEHSSRAAKAHLQFRPGNALVKSSGNPDPIRDDELEALICGCVDLLLSTLPPEQANIVRAIDLEGALPRSTTDIHGLSLNEVAAHLALGRKGLKDQFGEMYMICPQHGLAGCDCQSKGDAAT